MHSTPTCALLLLGLTLAACPDDGTSPADGEGGATEAAATDDGETEAADAGATDDAGTADGGSGDETGDPGEVDYVDALLSAMWADDVDIAVGADTITFTSDGVPDHDVLEVYALMDGTTVSVVTSRTTFAIPLAPTWSETTTDTGMGTIGFAISGAVYFNPYEGDGVTVAVDNNFDVGGIPFLDGCNGHPLPSGGTYHYHGVPYCITDVVDTVGEHSALVGVLLDGFPVYGPWGTDGMAPGDLDECSGHDGPTPEFPTGIYHYHLTETAPYSIDCYHGVVTDQGGGGMMPPPGGG